MIHLRTLLILLLLPVAALAGENPERWTVYYGSELPDSAFSSFDVIVLDSDKHPRIAPIKDAGKTVLGYLSLGEAEDYRSYFKTIKSKGLLMKANPQWKGHTVIDVRKPEWTEYVIDTLVPFVLDQGFDGIMIDTMDSPIDVETNDPSHFPGMQDGAVSLIKAMHAKYPHMKIMLNRGFALLPRVANDIDMVMAESIYTDWQPGHKKPRRVPQSEYQSTIDMLNNARKISPKLKIYTIDYWPPKDKAGVKEIYEAERAQGFTPYVSTLNLQAVYPEPQ